MIHWKLDDGDFDPDTGVWTGSNGEKIYPINYVASTPSSGNNSSSGDDGGAALLLLAGGVAVTATVVYLMNRAVLTADNITHNFFNGEKSLVIISDTVSDSAKAQIQSVAAGQKLAYFDVNCANLQNSIELIVPVKTFLRSNFKVYRVVNGTAAELKRLDAYPTDNASRIDGSYYVSGGTIYIYSSQPAEYAVGYNGL